MYWLVGLMSFAILGLIIGGLVLELRPALAAASDPGTHRPWAPNS
jgi:hypothetical protein